MHDLYFVVATIAWALVAILNLGLSLAYIDRKHPTAYNDKIDEWALTVVWASLISFPGPVTLPFILKYVDFGKFGTKFWQGESTNPNSRWWHRYKDAVRAEVVHQATIPHRRPASFALSEMLMEQGQKIRKFVAKAEGNILSIWE